MKFTLLWKKKPRPEHEYVYVAINQVDKTVLNYHVGLRNKTNTKIFLNKLFRTNQNIEIVHSDAFKPYKPILRNRGVEHTTVKYLTTHIESLNSILRHRLSTFNRRSRNISKSKMNFILILNLFFFRYNIKISNMN